MLPSQPTPIHQTGQSVSHNPQYQFLVILGTISKPTSDKKVKVYAYLVFLQVLLVLPSLWIVGFAMSFPQVLLTRLFARSSVVLCYASSFIICTDETVSRIFEIARFQACKFVFRQTIWRKLEFFYRHLIGGMWICC